MTIPDRAMAVALLICSLVNAVFIVKEFIVVWRKEKAEKLESAPETTTEIVERSESDVETLPPENPKVAALRGLTRQSMLLNIQQMDALRQMADVARMHYTATNARHSPMEDSWDWRAEWDLGSEWGRNNYD